MFKKIYNNFLVFCATICLSVLQFLFKKLNVGVLDTNQIALILNSELKNKEILSLEKSILTQDEEIETTNAPKIKEIVNYLNDISTDKDLEFYVKNSVEQQKKQEKLERLAADKIILDMKNKKEKLTSTLLSCGEVGYIRRVDISKPIKG